jgi:hypothetical protein
LFANLQTFQAREKETTMFNDLPLFRLSDPVTSREGAKAVKPRKTSQAMLLLAEYQHKPLTDEEAGIASGLVHKPKCGYWKRCSELRALGLIMDTNTTRPSSAGCSMMVCEITAAGREALR